MYYKSPSCYNFLRENLKIRLPAKSSLCRWAPIKHLKPGINQSILKGLKQKVHEMESQAKHVVIIFDEVKIRPDLEYDRHGDIIDGFSQINKERFSNIANYLTVFMIRGIFQQFKYMVAYHASNTTMNGNQLTEILLDTIKILSEVGLNVVAMVCDQGSNNRKAFNLLNISINQPYFLYNGHKIFALYDPPHLVKSFRNNLLKANLETPDGVVSWRILEELYECEKGKSTKLCPKLTSRHIYPNHFEKMRVKLATQIFSRTVVAGIKTLSDYEQFSMEAKPYVLSTANFLSKIDKTFDNLNSKVLFDPNQQKCALKINNAVNENLNFMLSYFENVKPINRKNVYCFKGIRQTIKAILLLFKELTNEIPGVEFLLTSRLNQDPIENLFGLVRQRGGNNPNPSLHEFNNIAAQIMTIKFLENSNLANCEMDDDELLTPELLTDINEHNLENHGETDYQNINNLEQAESVEEENNLDLLIVETNVIENEEFDEASSKYFTGYVAHTILKRKPCDNCRKILIKSGDTMRLKNESFLFYKNYTNNSEFGNLKAPSDTFFEICKSHIKITEQIFITMPQIENIKEYICNICIKHTESQEKFRTWFDKENPCFDHNLKLLDFMILVLLRKKCKWQINKTKKIKTNIGMSSYTRNM